MKEYKIFVSSTFVDMQVERDMLKQIVSPRLEEFFHNSDIHVAFIDLRWGLGSQVTNREELILQSCFDEIKNCQPLFVSFLGERYGWIPEDNTKRSSLYGLNDADYKMLMASPEISVTEMEILYGAFGSLHSKQNCIFCFRNMESYDGLTHEEREIYFEKGPEIASKTDTKSKSKSEKLTLLKEKILKAKQESDSDNLSIINYSIPLSQAYSAQLSSLEELADELTKQIITYIQKDCGNDKIKMSIGLKDMFLSAHSFNYISRDKEERELLNLCKDDNVEFLVIQGEREVGKSYLLARLFTCLERDGYLPLVYSPENSKLHNSPNDLINCLSAQLAEYLDIDNGMDLDELLSICEMNEFRPIIMLDSPDLLFSDQSLQELPFLKYKIKTIVTSNNKGPKYELVHGNVFRYYIKGLNGDEAKRMLMSLGQYYHFSIEDLISAICSKNADTSSLTGYNALWLNYIIKLLVNLNAFDFNSTKGFNVNSSTEGGEPVGMYKEFLEKVKNKNYTSGNIQLFLEDLIEFVSDTSIGLLHFIIDKAMTMFGKYDVLFYLGVKLLFKESIPHSVIQAIYKSDWNESNYSRLKKWFDGYKIDEGILTEDFFHKEELHQISEKVRDEFLSICRNEFYSYDEVRGFDLRKEYSPKNIDEEAPLFKEFIRQSIISASVKDLVLICEHSELSDYVGEAIISELLKIKMDLVDDNKSVFTNWSNGTYSQYDNTCINLLSFQECYEGSTPLDYIYTILTITCRLLQLQSGEEYRLLGLYFFVIEALEKLPKNIDEYEREFTLPDSEAKLKTVANLKTRAYGNICKVCKRLREFQAALLYLDRRKDAYTQLALEQNISKNEVDYVSQMAYMNYEKATIYKSSFGFSGRTIELYKEAAKKFKEIEKLDFDYPHKLNYCECLRELSAYYRVKHKRDICLDLSREALEINLYYIDSIGSHEFYMPGMSYSYYVGAILSIECLISNLEHFNEIDEVEELVCQALGILSEIYPHEYNTKEIQELYCYFKSKEREICQQNKDWNNLNREEKFFRLLSTASRIPKTRRNQQIYIKTMEDAIITGEEILKTEDSVNIRKLVGEAYFNIGHIYANKENIQKYGELAERYLKRAAYLGVSKSYDVLGGIAMLRGDKSGVVEYLKKGAELGSSESTFRLSLVYYHEGDIVAGKKYLERACEFEDINALIFKACSLFDGENGYDRDIFAAKNILLLLAPQNEYAEKIFKCANEYAREYEGWGVRISLLNYYHSLMNAE